MKTRCPACGATSSLDALLGHSEASRAFLASLTLAGDLAAPLIRYLGLFRSEQRDLTFDRTARLLGELAPDITAGQIRRGHHSYPAPKAAWIWAIGVMIERRDQGKLQLPLKNHGYLYEVISGYKPENAPPAGHNPAQMKSVAEMERDLAEHERQKSVRPTVPLAEMMAFSRMVQKQPERGLKDIPNEHLLAHLTGQKRPDESLEDCYQRLKALENAHPTTIPEGASA